MLNTYGMSWCGPGNTNQLNRAAVLSQQKHFGDPGTPPWDFSRLGVFYCIRKVPTPVLNNRHPTGEVESSGTDSESSMPYALHFLRTVPMSSSEQLVVFIVSESLTNPRHKNE